MTSITVYSKPNCQACRATYRKLNQLGLAYEHVDITEDAEAMEYVMTLGHKEAPIVVLGDGTHWGGYRQTKLEALADG